MPSLRGVFSIKLNKKNTIRNRSEKKYIVSVYILISKIRWCIPFKRGGPYIVTTHKDWVKIFFILFFIHEVYVTEAMDKNANMSTNMFFVFEGE